MCDWSELRQLAYAGAEIGCHAVSHPCLCRESAADVRSELALARAQLEAALARPVRHLAYPYGKREHVGAREVAIARELGFASAVTTRQGALFSAHAAQLHALPRVEVTPSFAASPRYLQTILMGLPLWARNRGRLVMTL
jgi:peptidoglycan/xylan/chitin deacetylase (PgdA/CDA1 family)